LRELAVCGSVMNHSQTESTIKHNQISKLKQVEVWLIILKVIYIYSEWMFTNSYAHYCWKLIMLLLLILYEVELVYVCFWILKLREKKLCEVLESGHHSASIPMCRSCSCTYEVLGRVDQ